MTSCGKGMIDSPGGWEGPPTGRSGPRGSFHFSNSVFLSLFSCLCLLSLSEFTHSSWGWGEQDSRVLVPLPGDTPRPPHSKLALRRGREVWPLTQA